MTHPSLPAEAKGLRIHFTNRYEEACALRDGGFEPIECAFGGHGSVLGPLAMDHHGTESWRPGVAIRACRDHFGTRSRDPRFVVTGTPDADAVLSIVALAGLVPQHALPDGFPELVDRHDRNPIGLDLESERHGFLLLAFNQTHLEKGQPGFYAGVARMIELLRHGLPPDALRHVLGQERSRKERAARSLKALYLPDGQELSPPASGPGPGEPPPRVALVRSSVWGFDVWYRWAPVVVSFAERLEKVTIGCPDDATAERLYGPGGLHVIYDRMGKGWGGRAAVGGSPRGVALTYADAEATARVAATLLRPVSGSASPPR